MKVSTWCSLCCLVIIMSQLIKSGKCEDILSNFPSISVRESSLRETWCVWMFIFIHNTFLLKRLENTRQKCGFHIHKWLLFKSLIAFEVRHCSFKLSNFKTIGKELCSILLRILSLVTNSFFGCLIRAFFRHVWVKTSTLKFGFQLMSMNSLGF